MVMFSFIAALFLAGALLMLLPALLRPVGAAPAAPRSALGVALVVPGLTVALYLLLGNPASIAPMAGPAAAPAAGARHNPGGAELQQRAAALAERLRAQPADGEGWLVLGRSYTLLGRYADAATAMRRAADLLPRNPNVLADLADVLGMAQGRRLAGEPARMIQAALDMDPRHPKALALAGSVAFEQRDWSAARSHYERLLAVLPADSAMQRSVRGSLAEASRLEALADSGGAAPVGDAGRPAAAAAASTISGEVRIAPELAARVGPGDTLFIFARATQGSRMPLAIARQAAAGSKIGFTLDDTMAMPGGPRLSSAAEVTIGARISRSGNATPQSGDLVGQSPPLAQGTRGIVVTIDRVQP